MEGKALATTVLISIMSLIVLVVVWGLMYEAKNKRTTRAVDTATTDGATLPETPTPAPRKRDSGTVMPMSRYSQYLVGLARELNTADMDTIYAHHEAFCARCGVQFSREALAHLNLFGPGGGMRNVTVIGATREGNDIRSGRCPMCGSAEMRVVTK